MAYRNKTYVCFDGDNDMHYYRLMLAWKQNDNTSFDFYNAHDLNQARDTSLEETIKAKLRERMNFSRILVVLVGESTRYLYKFVRWEIEEAMKRDLPIVVVNLNGKRDIDNNLSPPIVRDHLSIHVSFNARIIQYALENWPTEHSNQRRQEKDESYYYLPSVYSGIGL